MPYTEARDTMAINVNTVYVTFGGRQAGNEQWQCGLHFTLQGAGGSAQQVCQTVADGSVAPLTTLWSAQGFSDLRGANMTMDYVKVYYYAADQTASGAVAQRTLALTSAGTDRCPPQVALVASLRTPDPSRYGKGRIYLPAMGVNVVSGTGQASPALVTNLATAIRNLGVAIAAISIVGDWVVGSRAAVVGTVVVDSVLDTQRRRRDKLVATSTGTSSTTTQ